MSGKIVFDQIRDGAEKTDLRGMIKSDRSGSERSEGKWIKAHQI